MRHHSSTAIAALSSLALAGLALAGIALLVPSASPTVLAAGGEPGDIVINELDSTTDQVELFNKGSVAVDISGWLQVDSDTTHAAAAIAPAGTSLEPGAFYVFASTWGLGGGGDGVRLLLPDGVTTIDSVDYPANAAGVSHSRCPDGTGTFGGVHTATFGQSNAVGCAPAPEPTIDPNWDDIVINEFSSAGADPIELYNTGSQPVNIAGWRQTDNGGVPLAFTPSVASIPAGGFATFNSTAGLSGNGDAVRLYLPDGTLVEEVAFGTNAAAPSYARCPDGTGVFKTTAAATFGATNEPGCNAAPVEVDPNWDDIVINEISSDNDPLPVGDAVELYNAGTEPVSIAGWTQTDSGHAPAPISPDVTVIAPGGYAVFASTQGLSGEGDGVRLYLPDGTTLVDEVTYPDGGAGDSDTYEDLGIVTGVHAFAACPDGASEFFPVAEKSFGDSNFGACDNKIVLDELPESPWLDLDCLPEHASGTGTVTVEGLNTWPGSADVAVADAECAWKTATGTEGRDMSGLDIDPAEPGVMWAVKNKNWLFRLVRDGNVWVPDATTPGWSAGKEIRFPGGTGLPDSEGVTVGGDGAVYVTTERNNTASAIPLNSVLRLDPTSPEAVLSATQQWDLTAEFVYLASRSGGSNLGFEGLTFVPDSYLTTNGFVDDNTGLAYDPADYPGHGTGLFFVALEDDGHLYGFALNNDGSYARIAKVDTGLGRAMDVQYDPTTERIWAICDNTCSVAFSVLKVDAEGALVPEVKYAAPAGLPIVNIEGFALAPTCADGVREITWSDDSLSAEGTPGHALYAGTLPCSLELGSQGLEPELVLGDGRPGAAQRGATVTISAAGFAKGEALEIWVDSAPLLQGTVGADADGTATVSVTLPPSFRAGWHSIVVTGELSGATVTSPLVLTDGHALRRI